MAKDAPVGFRAIRLAFDLDTDADEEQLATLLKLTERYCVVLQTLRAPAETSATLRRGLTFRQRSRPLRPRPRQLVLLDEHMGVELGDPLLARHGPLEMLERGVEVGLDLGPEELGILLGEIGRRVDSRAGRPMPVSTNS